MRAIKRAGSGEAVRISIVGRGVREKIIVRLAHVSRVRIGELEACPLYAAAEIRDLLLQADDLPAINRSPLGKTHHIDALTRMKAGERAERTRRAAGHLRWTANAGVAIGR